MPFHQPGLSCAHVLCFGSGRARCGWLAWPQRGGIGPSVGSDGKQLVWRTWRPDTLAIVQVVMRHRQRSWTSYALDGLDVCAVPYYNMHDRGGHEMSHCTNYACWAFKNCAYELALAGCASINNLNA